MNGITEDFHIDLLRVFVKHKMVPEIVLRDELVRREYHSLLNNGHGKTKRGEIRRQLADKFCLGEKSIEVILYETRHSKGLPIFFPEPVNGNGNK
jgi:hypothetical protein